MKLKGTSMYMDQARAVAIDIIEEFEDLLKRKNIEIPSDERPDDEDYPRIVGTDHEELESKIAKILRDNGMIEKE